VSDHPSDAALAALAEGSAAAPAAQHLAGCAACRSRVAEYRAAARLLAEASPAGRRYCPPREALCAEASPALERHLQACAWCAADRADWSALEAAPQGAAARRGVARWLLDAAAGALALLEARDLAPVPAPAWAAARGEQATPPPPPPALVTVFGAGALTLQAAPGRGAVDLRLAADAAAPRPFRSELRGAGDAPLESRVSDADGAATFTDLAPGSYRLQVFAPGAADADLDLAIELTAAFDKPAGPGYTEGGGVSHGG